MVVWWCGGVVVWCCGGVVWWWCGGGVVVVWWCGGVVGWWGGGGVVEWENCWPSIEKLTKEKIKTKKKRVKKNN